ncbi:MAG: amino acid permease [Cyclobacteriaceae bacterium]|nr:amino acid permease [Cyclobacteriaceae bacterium]
MSTPPDEGLKRVVGVRTLAINAVNMTIGAGIFALPALVATAIGASAFLAYIVCTALLGLVLLCFVEVGTKISTSGGAYAYIEEAFGPLAGFLTNTIFWLGFTTLANAAVINVMVNSLELFFPKLGDPVFRGLFFLVVFAGLSWLNIRGSKESTAFVTGVTLLKLVPLLLLIVFGVAHMNSENLHVSEWPSWHRLGEASLILFFAFGGGAEATLSATGEIKRPTYTIPRGLLLGVVIVFLFYLSIQAVAQGVLGDALAEQKEAPLVAVASVVFGSRGLVLMSVAAAVSCFGLISGDMFVSSRVPYAAARDGLLPSIFAKIHPKFSTPHFSILLYAFVSFVYSISGSFRQLAVLSSASILLIYVGVIAATIKLRKREVEGAYINPGGLTIPVLALLATGWFLSNLEWKEIVAVIIFLVFFTIVYFLMKTFQKNQ